jgi:hypothetical protein
MPNEIVSYLDMCRREGASLQRGMNYSLGGRHSVILVSRRRNAPYRDRVEEDGTTLIYEGHDAPRSPGTPHPKEIDQPVETPTGALTENGKFARAAREYKEGKREPELVRAYEKLHQGVCSYNGTFLLVDAWREDDGLRKVFKFKLTAVEDADNEDGMLQERPRRRVIPTAVKLEVWKRDGGKCAVCGADDELHFDHIVPYSKGGTSITAENVQLLCARHNLEKGDKII